jgi:hypothetical protein
VVAKVKAHLDQARKNQHSKKTLTVNAPLLPKPEATLFHPVTLPMFAPITVLPRSSHPPPVKSTPTKLVNLLFVLNDYNSNSILAEVLCRHTGSCFLAGYQILHARLVAAGLRTKLQRLDNECSVTHKQFLVAEDVDYQLVPPQLHRKNAAKCAIRLFNITLLPVSAASTKIAPFTFGTN